MRIVVVNSGSSSIKYEIFDVNDLTTLTRGMLESIGSSRSRLKHQALAPDGTWQELVEESPIADHRDGFAYILETTRRTRAGNGPSGIYGVGHRVVHGGEAFKESVVIDPAVLASVERLIPLAPLHNPANLTGIRIMGDLLPDVPQVAVFDTAFHQTMPPKAFLYALPYEFYQAYSVRRYGFHGSSHAYVAAEAARYLGKPPEGLNLITLHLGNGASAAAVERGRSVDTSMGLTPLEGLIMGTRCGDLDPAIHFYLARRTHKPMEEIEGVLNRESGLKGLCGLNDMRDILDRAREGDSRAALAIESFCYRIKKYIGAYLAVLGSADAIVFTGGIGENSPAVREKSCEGLAALGIVLDQGRNREKVGAIAEIQGPGSRVKILIIRTNEEYEIARQTRRAIRDPRRGAGRGPQRSGHPT